MSDKDNGTIILIGVAIALLIVGLGVGYFVGQSGHGSLSQYNSGTASNKTVSTAPTTSAQPTTVSTAATTIAQAQQSSLGGATVREVIAQNKTATLPAASYNPAYNYVKGCYYIGGYYNFSFYAPYSGYILINETNTGMPTNFTDAYFFAYLSNEKPWYDVVSPYNESSWCTGETFTSSILPWIEIAPYNNQTMMVPVKNGTNYIIFENFNADLKHGVNPFPINVIYSITYYGFKNVTYPNPPITNQSVSPNAVPVWSKYP